MAMEEMEVSTLSMPASTHLRIVEVDNPVVAWHCIVNGDITGGFQTAYQFVTHVGMQQARHVLDGNGVCAHILDTLALLNPGFDVVHRTEGVGDRPLGVLADRLTA